MAQTIKLKRSATQGAIPSTSSLDLGEVAINTYDGKMYIKKDDGTPAVVEIGDVTQADVTAHEAALSITKSQVTDLATSDLDLGTNKILYSNVYSTLGDLPDASSYHGMFAHVHGTGKAYYAHAGSWVELANVSELFDGAYSSLTGTPSIPTVLTDLSITDGTDGQVLTTDGSGNFTFEDSVGGTELIVLSTKAIDNPNAYNTSTSDEFGYAVAVSGNYTIVGAPREDTATSGSVGKAYIFDTASGSLLHTLDSPINEAGALFGWTVDVSGNYAIVGCPNVDGIETDSGRVYIYDVTTGTLIHTIENPNAYSVATYDYFGTSVSISGKYAIASATFEDDDSGSSSGKAYIFDVATGSLLYTLNNPNPMNTSTGDKFGNSVSISGNYAIVGAAEEDNSSGSFNSGYAYIYDISSFTTSTISTPTYTLSNPNAYGGVGGFASDNFGRSVSISGNYAIVGANGEDDAGGSSSGKAYVYDISTFTTSTISSANYVLDNPNAYSTSQSDEFGYAVAISGNYAIVSAYGEDDTLGTPSNSGKAYIYDISTFTTSTISSANYVLDNPNAYTTSAEDKFGFSVAISGNYAIVGAYLEDDAGGNDSGKAYIFRTNSPEYSYSASEIASFAPASSGGGVALTDFSVTQNAASGNGTLSYNNTSGVFTYTPPNLSSYLTSVAFGDLTSTPTTLAGYGITDAFDGAYSSLTGAPTTVSSFTNDSGYLTSVAFGDLTSTPTTLAGYGITDAFDGAYSSLTGAPTTVSSFTNDSGYLTSVAFGDLTSTPTTLAGYGITDAFDGAYSSLTGAPTTVSSFTNDAGYLTSETTTTLTGDSVNQKLVFTDETGTPNDIDLSWTVDDTNLARITSGSVNGSTGIATFTRDDATTFTVDFSALFDDTNLTRITSGSVSGSTLTLTRSDATTVSVDVSSLLDNTDTVDYINAAVFNAGTGVLSLTGVGDAGATVNLDGRYLTSVAFSDLTSTPTTLAGYGITDAFDGDYSSLSNSPTSILNFGITDGTAGQVLQTDGLGNFSFTTVSGSGGAGTGYAGYEDYYYNVVATTTTFGTASNTHDKVQVFKNGVYLDDSQFSFVQATGIVTLTTPAENGDEITVWGFNSTNLDNHELFSVDGLGNITAPGTIQIGNHRKEGSLTSTIASVSPANVVMYVSADYVGSKLIITVTDNITGDTQITEALILTVNGGTPKITTYGTMYTSANALSSFDVANVSTDTALEVTMASSNSSTIKVAYTLLDA